MVKVCDVCGKEFESKPSAPHQKRCSRKCSLEYGRLSVSGWVSTKYIQKCDVCGKEFESSRFYQKRCSHKCSLEYARLCNGYVKKTYAKKCVICGRNFISKQPHTLTCSTACRKAMAVSYKAYCYLCKRPVYGTSNICYQKYVVCRECKGIQAEQYKASMPTVLAEIRQKTENIEHESGVWRKRGFSEGLKRAVRDRDGWQCYICHKETNLHVHHIIPRRHGGENSMENLVTLCGGCHMSVESGNTDKAISKCVERAMANIY